MTKFQLALVGIGLLTIGIGISVWGIVSHNEALTTFGALLFGTGLGAVGIKRPMDA